MGRQPGSVNLPRGLTLAIVAPMNTLKKESPMKMKTILVVAALITCPLQANWWDSIWNGINNIYLEHLPHSAYSSSHKSNSMNERNAKNYIEQLVHSLNNALRPHMKHSKLKKLLQRIRNAVLNNRAVYQQTPYGKRYKKDMVDQYANGAILEFIEQRAYKIAYKKSGNHSIARRVSESMRNNALACIQQNDTVNFERITTFVGKSLKRAVRNAINTDDVPYRPTYNNSYETSYTEPSTPSYSYQHSVPSAQAPPTYNHHEPVIDFEIYPSEDCCSCMESFDDVNRVFIKPCGHDICALCAQDWFFTNKNNTCPHCRTAADPTHLAAMITMVSN